MKDEPLPQFPPQFLAVGHGEMCAAGCRDLAQLLHVCQALAFFPLFSPFCSEGWRSRGRAPSRVQGPCTPPVAAPASTVPQELWGGMI